MISVLMHAFLENCLRIWKRPSLAGQVVGEVGFEPTPGRVLGTVSFPIWSAVGQGLPPVSSPHPLFSDDDDDDNNEAAVQPASILLHNNI